VWIVDLISSGKLHAILSSNIAFEVFLLSTYLETPMVWILETLTACVIFFYRLCSNLSVLICQYCIFTASHLFSSWLVLLPGKSNLLIGVKSAFKTY
jgi:hypothetical protein